MESERANLDCQIRMQQESMEIKDAEMKKLREQIEQVKPRFSENASSNKRVSRTISHSSDVCTFCGF